DAVRVARERFEAIVTIDPAVADRGELDRLVSLVGQVRSFLDSVEVAVGRRVRALAQSSADASPSDVLGNKGRRPKPEATAAGERSGVCDRFPGFDEALANGAIASGHVDALANATKGLDAAAISAVAGFTDALVNAAAGSTVAEFEKECRNLVEFLTGDDGSSKAERQRNDRRCNRWIDKKSGMWKLFAELDPEAGAKLWAALDAHLATVKQRAGNSEQPIERLTADALVECVTGSRPESGDRPAVPEVTVLIDWQTLRDGLHESSVHELSNGVSLPVASIRRLCCEAVVVPVLLGPDGRPVDVGREQRTATRKQRRMLRAMYRTCGHPHCDTAFDWCDIHHITPWEHGGPTDLDNLLPLCSKHHHLVHDGGWRLSLDDQRRVRLRSPDGHVTIDGPPVTARAASPPRAA
ncbi:MAG: HNH endonuclease, partial [Ilumatobacteraceae bacterium]|nr:HNH endonuclease [Ilumatobacteraceae bacterium]